MKISTRKLLLNRYVIFCFGFVLLFQLFSYWVLSGSLEVIFKMGWDWYLKTGPSFSIYPVSGFNLLQTVFPLVASIFLYYSIFLKTQGIFTEILKLFFGEYALTSPHFL